MVWLARSTYHDKVYVVGDTKEEAEKRYLGSLEVTASNLAENEVEDGWKDYYDTWDKAFDATYDVILDQLKGEAEYIEVQSIKELNEYKEEFEDRDVYAEALAKIS